MEGLEVFGGSAFPGVCAGLVGDAEVSGDLADDFCGGLGFEVEFEVRGVEAVEELGLEGLAFVRGAGALDGVFDVADDVFAGGDAGCRPGLGRGAGGVGLGGGGLVEFLGEEDGAADGSGDALEGVRKGGGLSGGGGRGGLGGLGGGDLLVEVPGDVGAHGDEVVEDLVVVGCVVGAVLLRDGVGGWHGT